MRSTVFSLILVLGLVSVVSAADINVRDLAIKTLPADLYGKLVPGKKLALVWKDPNFKAGPPSAVSASWKAEDRNGTLFAYLKTEEATLTEPNGTYTIELVATYYREGKVGYLGDKPPELIVEGLVKQGETVMGAFVTKTKGKLAGLGGWGYEAMVDAVLAGISSDFINAK